MNGHASASIGIVGTGPAVKGGAAGSMTRRKRPVKTERRVPVSIYLEPGVARKLKSAAEKDRRSTSTLAAILVEKGLDSWDTS
jgi:hypothetical protein